MMEKDQGIELNGEPGMRNNDKLASSNLKNRNQTSENTREGTD